MRLRNMGLKVTEIAKLLGKSHSTVVYHTNEKHRKTHNKRSVKRSTDIMERLRVEFGGACCVCGYDEYLPALHFHHIDPKKKSFGLGRGGGKSYTELLREAEKCVLVCSICHIKLHGKVISLTREHKARRNPRPSPVSRRKDRGGAGSSVLPN